ncbi:hypothetical protein HMPREF9374_2107 [Desmospora sp. 8437]|nr:hypothetical protein HMPREF9374_2107 [Desmospora sp. 8437]
MAVALHHFFMVRNPTCLLTKHFHSPQYEQQQGESNQHDEIDVGTEAF